MKQIATVDRILANGRAEILVARQSACAHDCHDCAGCGGTPTPIRAVVDNPIGARAWEKVVVESSTKQMLGVILLVYMVPVALFFIAYFATASLGSDALAAGISILAFFIGVVPAIRYDRRIRQSGDMTFTIVRAF